MKPKILTYSLDKRDTTSWWRMMPLAYISNDEFEIKDISDLKVFDWTVFVGCDVFLLQRPFGREHAQVIQAAKNMGCRVILDYDDDLTCVDIYNPTYELYRSNQENMITCIKMADEIWVSTPSIEKSFLPYNKNIYIIPNAHNDYLFKPSNKKPFDPNGKACYYRGGASHQADVNSIANKLIETINKNSSWTFAFMGDRFTYLEMNCGDNYHIVPAMTIMDYFRYIHKENPQAFIFPLCDTKFNSGKSNISWIEATYSGASFWGNTKLAEFQRPGIGEISNIDFDSDLKAMHDSSWEYITDNLLVSKINKTREERLLNNLQ